MDDEDEWFAQLVLPRLHPKSCSNDIQAAGQMIRAATVALMTPSEFKESWELPLSLCIFPNAQCKRLGFDAREIDSDESTVTMAQALSHILPTATTHEQQLQEEQCLYLWPGDQSRGFQGYPTEIPLNGPFPIHRLELVRGAHREAYDERFILRQ